MSQWTPERIRALRETLGMTREEMAQEIGVALASIYRWETGKAEPTKLARRALSHLETERQIS